MADLMSPILQTMPARQAAKGTRWEVACLSGLLLVSILFLWPAWRQPNGFWYAPGAEFSDLAVTHWPNIWFTAQTLREHAQVPLWRPLIMGGAPFVGNPLAALFYPPNFLLALATAAGCSLSAGFHVLFCLHLWGAGAAMYGLTHWSYHHTRPAALVAALGYMLTPKVIAHIGAGHVGLSQAFAWLPLLLWLLRSALQRQSARRAGVCGLALSMAYLADPRVAFYGALVLGAYTAYRLLGHWRIGAVDHVRMTHRVRATHRVRTTLACGLCALLVPLVFVAASAVQLLPTRELMSTTTRSALTVAEAGRDSLPWRYLAGYLLADRGGYHEWMTYLGLPPLFLAVFALWRGHERERWFWAGLAAVGLLFSLGTNTPFYPLLYSLLPALGWVRVPPRALLWVILSSNLLAGWGADALFQDAPSPTACRRCRLAAVAGLAASIGLGLGFALTLGAEMPPALIALAASGAALMVVWLLVLQGPSRIPSAYAHTLLMAMLLVDLWTVGHSLLELRPTHEVFAGDEAAVALAAVHRPPEPRFRVYSPSYSIPQHIGARLGLEQLDGVDPSQLRWTAEFMRAAGGYTAAGYGVTIPSFPDGSDVRSAWRDAIPDAALLGLLNGRFVVAEYPIVAPNLTLYARTGSSWVYENERWLPRAFTVTYVERVDSWESVPPWARAQARLTGRGNLPPFDPAQGALVEGGRDLDGPPGWVAAPVTLYTPNRIVVEAESTEPALLVLSEIWYPGWQVQVDGLRQPVVRVNGIVRGVYLEPGSHTVTWEYRPASLRWGAMVSAGTLLGCVLWWLAGKRERVR
jgi:hypothetical protein